MMKKFVAFLLTLLFLSPLALARNDHYYVPPSQFEASLDVTPKDLPVQKARFKRATAAFAYEISTETIRHLRLAVYTEHLSAPNHKIETAIDTLLENETYPEITFTTNEPADVKDGKAKIKGVLSLHGESKEISFEGTIKEEKETHEATLNLSGAVRCSDFGISNTESTRIALGPDITLHFNMRAIRQ